MKKSILSIIFLVLIAEFLFAKEKWFNGYEWETLPEWGKIGWATGFLEGTYRATSETYNTFVLTTKSNEEIFDVFSQRILLGKVTVGQLIIGLDKFYEDYRNKDIKTMDAIYLVNLQLIGVPEDFFNETTRILRIDDWKERTDEVLSLRQHNEKYKQDSDKWQKYLPTILFILSE